MTRVRVILIIIPLFTMVAMMVMLAGVPAGRLTVRITDDAAIFSRGGHSSGMDEVKPQSAATTFTRREVQALLRLFAQLDRWPDAQVVARGAEIVNLRRKFQGMADRMERRGE